MPSKLIDNLYPIGYSFVKKTESPDISFRRVGVNAGTISTDINKNEQSHYFIAIDNFSPDILELLQNIKFTFNNTVGPKSISKQELIREFNKTFDTRDIITIINNQKIIYDSYAAISIGASSSSSEI